MSQGEDAKLLNINNFYKLVDFGTKKRPTIGGVDELGRGLELVDRQRLVGHGRLGKARRRLVGHGRDWESKESRAWESRRS